MPSASPGACQRAAQTFRRLASRAACPGRYRGGRWTLRRPRLLADPRDKSPYRGYLTRCSRSAGMRRRAATRRPNQRSDLRTDRESDQRSDGQLDQQSLQQSDCSRTGSRSADGLQIGLQKLPDRPVSPAHRGRRRALRRLAYAPGGRSSRRHGSPFCSGAGYWSCGNPDKTPGRTPAGHPAGRPAGLLRAILQVALQDPATILRIVAAHRVAAPAGAKRATQ
jgi:hypothetical protein